MLARVALRLCGFVWLVALFGVSPPVRAQCRLCGEQEQSSTPQASEVPPSVEIETNLNFGGLLLIGTGEGGATLHPDGSTVVTGGLSGASGQRMAGTVRVQGEPGRVLKIEVPQQVELHSLNGDHLVIEEILTDLPSAPRLDSTGRLSFRFGGRLKVSGDADGEYRGDLPLTIDYL
jgi:hypothetical protein